MKNKSYPLYEHEQIHDLKALIHLTEKKYAHKPAFTFERKKERVSVSYVEFKSDTEGLATALWDIGIQNAKVALIGENSYEWILTYFSVINSGGVIVPLDRDLPLEDIKFLCEDAEVEALVYSKEFADYAAYLQETAPNIRHYINMKIFPELLEQGKQLIRDGKDTAVAFEVDRRALAAISYTSGTTGRAKGVMLSHNGLARDALAACQFVGIFGSNMLILPLHHSFGFVAGVCSMLLKGSEIYINSSLKNVLADMEKFGPGNLFLVPLFVETFYRKIWDSAKKQEKEKLLKKLISISNALLFIGIDMRRLLFKSVLQAFGGNLKLIVSGGAPLNPEYVQGFRDFGINVLNGYGITECSPIVSVNRNHYSRRGSIGQVLPCCSIKIAEPDEDGHGEIYVKGDIVTLGYWKNPQVTKAAFDGEWFKTGDIGYLDDDGFLFISGRKKNLIILNNGKNVAPEELEISILNHIPYVKEAVVYAEDNTIVAEVFFSPDHLQEDILSCFDRDIISFNRTQAPYKNISRTVVRDIEFPKTTTKKIKRDG